MTEYKHTVAAHMSRSPRCIALTENLQEAAEIMRDLGIRHIPVLERGRPVGMLSERDIALSATVSGRPLDQVQVLEAMTRIPYCTPPTTPASAVARHLATRKLDAALIMSGNRILGMFTITDALNLLAEALEERPDRARAGRTRLSA